MRALVVEREMAHPDRLRGRVLAHELRGAGGERVFDKGRILADADLPVVLGLPWRELHVIEMDANDLHEDDAGARIAAAAAGEHIEVREQSGGHWPLAATRRGLLEVETAALAEVNGLEGLCVYTLFAGHVVDAAEVVARAKITPFVLEAARVAEAERLARARAGLVRVRPFVAMRVGAVVQETLGDRARERFRDALAEKIGWFGATLLEPRFVPPDETAVADALGALAAAGARVIAVAGTKAMDLLDPAFRALGRLGAAIERHGVPAHPGSLFWLARLGDVPVVGVPSCGLFSQATVFDLLLPRLLAGERLGAPQLAALGHGGFLTRDMAFRFPPYRPSAARGALD